MIFRYVDSNWRTLEFNVSGADIEEAIGRCGWMILNDATLTAEDRAEVDRLERQGFASIETQPSDKAIAWWKSHSRIIKGAL